VNPEPHEVRGICPQRYSLIVARDHREQGRSVPVTNLGRGPDLYAHWFDRLTMTPFIVFLIYPFDRPT